MCLHELLSHHHHLSLRCCSCPARPRPGLRLPAASCFFAGHLRVAAETRRDIARSPGCSWPSRDAARSAASRRRSCWSDVKMTRVHETSSGTCPDTVLLPAARLGWAGAYPRRAGGGVVERWRCNCSPAAAMSWRRRVVVMVGEGDRGAGKSEAVQPAAASKQDGTRSASMASDESLPSAAKFTQHRLILARDNRVRNAVAKSHLITRLLLLLL